MSRPAIAALTGLRFWLHIMLPAYMQILSLSTSLHCVLPTSWPALAAPYTSHMLPVFSGPP